MSGVIGFKLFLNGTLFLCSIVLVQAFPNDQDTVRSSKDEKVLKCEMLLKIAQQRWESDSTLALRCAKEASTLSRNVGYLYGEALSDYILGNVFGYKIMDFKKGIDFYEQSLAASIKLDSLDLVAKNHSELGILYYNLGFYASALNHFLAAFDHYDRTNNAYRKAMMQVNIASIYAEWSDESYLLALQYYEKSMAKANELNDDFLKIYTTYYLTTTLLNEGDYKEAEDYLLKGIEIIKSNDSLGNFAPRLYANEGSVILFQKKNPKDALSYFEKSKQISDEKGIKSASAYALLHMGKACMILGQYDKAGQYYQEALQGYSKIGMTKKIAEVYDGLTNLAQATHSYEKALEYRSLQLACMDNISEDQRNNLFQETRNKISRITNESKSYIRKKDRQINMLYLIEVVIVLLASSLFFLLYLNRQRLRAAKDKATLTNEKLLLEKELESKRLKEEKLKQKEEKLRQQLEFNAKTLTANTLNLIQKNEILEKIKVKAEEIKKASTLELPSKINNLMQAVNFALNIDKDWENFKIHFEQVHNNFFENLKAKYPDLNSNDLKLCALLKLNLDTKEIASIMDISPESVKVARSRLRKKLQLEHSDNLSSFITQV